MEGKLIRTTRNENGGFSFITETVEMNVDDMPLSTESKIFDLKSELAASDYKAIKHSEGLISDEDYAPIKEYRQSLRDRINELENNQPMEE